MGTWRYEKYNDEFFVAYSGDTRSFFMENEQSMINSINNENFLQDHVKLVTSEVPGKSCTMTYKKKIDEMNNE